MKGFKHANVTPALLEALCPRLSVTIRFHVDFLLPKRAFAGVWVSEPLKIDLEWKEEGGVDVLKGETKEGLDLEIFVERWQEQLKQKRRRDRNRELASALSALFVTLLVVMCQYI